MRKRAILIAVLSAVAATQVTAHHGFGRFDMNGNIELSGTVTGLEFVNPHSYLYFDVVLDDGSVRQMGCEMRAATVLRRSGWSPEMFAPGVTVEITGRPHRDDPTSCYVETIALGDGPALERYQQLDDSVTQQQDRPDRLPNGEPNISGDWAQEQYLMAQPSAVGARGVLVPKSMVAEVESGEIDPADAPNSGWGPRPVTLNERGKAREAVLAAQPVEETPRIACEITSILFDWVFDGPINRISQDEDVITIEYGRDLVRTIHMDMDSHPDYYELSRGGHSIGRWEDDTLVVDTIGFLPGRLAGNVPHSNQLHVVERFSLDRDRLGRLELNREFEARDPVYFEDTYAGSDIVLLADAPFAVDQCKELAFEYTEALQSGGAD